MVVYRERWPSKVCIEFYSCFWKSAYIPKGVLEKLERYDLNSFGQWKKENNQWLVGHQFDLKYKYIDHEGDPLPQEEGK